MAYDPEREKLDSLTARIHAAEGKPAVEQEEGVAPLKFSRVGFDFVGAVLGCTLLGWLSDKYLGTAPWGVMIMVLVGFGVGTFNVYRSWSGPKTE
jgi:F0F1-type ATP synthase assembly protein I